MADAADCQCDHKPDGRYPSAAENRNFSCLLLCRGSAFLFIPFFHLMRTGSCLGLSGRYSQQAAPCIWLLLGQSLSLRWQKAAGRIAERIRG